MQVCMRRGCDAESRRDEIMCIPCWSQVPPEIRDAVWRAYEYEGLEGKQREVDRAIAAVPPKEPAPPKVTAEGSP